METMKSEGREGGGIGVKGGDGDKWEEEGGRRQGKEIRYKEANRKRGEGRERKEIVVKEANRERREIDRKYGTGNRKEGKRNEWKVVSGKGVRRG